MKTNNFGKKSLIGLSLLTAVLCAGCSDDAKNLQAAINGFGDACTGTMVGEFHYSTYTNSITFRCDHINIKKLNGQGA